MADTDYTKGFKSGRDYAAETMIKWALEMKEKYPYSAALYNSIVAKAMRMKDDYGPE